MRFASGQQDGEEPPFSIRKGVDLRVAPSARAANSLLLLPPFPPEAERCALTRRVAGLPIMRAMWLHYPGDPNAVARGDQYLWGRDILVAPVVEKDATSRQLDLPQGDWFDLWTEQRVAGGKEIDRAVDLATMPLYVRSGAVIPMGPVKHRRPTG